MSPESFIVGACFTVAIGTGCAMIVAYVRARAARWARLEDRIFDAEKNTRAAEWNLSTLKRGLDEVKRDAKLFRESLETAGDTLQIQHEDINRLATHHGLEFRDVNAHRRLSPINRA